ncbi:MAG: hypothetical protein GXO69_09470 [Acidobacteria bacterium]|nr:hypothetical protein [Acidobacteriota bacterium]
MVSKCLGTLVLLLIFCQSIFSQGKVSAVKPVSVEGLDGFAHPPAVYVSDETLFLASLNMDGGREVVVLDMALTHVLGRYRIRAGQGPCEGNGLEALGGMDGKLCFLRRGNNEIVAFDKKGVCRSVCRLTGKKNRVAFIQPTGKPDRFAVSSLRFKGGQVSADVLLVENFSKIRSLISGLAASPLPPTIFLAGNILVITVPAENTPHFFQVHLVDTDDQNARMIKIPFVSPKTRYEISRGRAELKRYGMSLPEQVLKQKRLNSGVFGDEIGGRVFFIETVAHSEANREKYLHILNVKTGETGLLEIPFQFFPRTILGGACLGFMENKEGDFNLAMMELPVS